jgi:hypothetical protein
MAISPGYRQLQPKFILGSDQWVSAAAEQMVGADIDLANQLRDHMPFFAIARGQAVVVPRVERLATTGFVDASKPEIDTSDTTLASPPEEVELAAIEGAVELANVPIAIESYSIDQNDLQIEFKKIALRISFWNQFFRKRLPNGFRGLPDLVQPSQRVALNDPLSLQALDDLVGHVTEADGEMDRKVVVMNQAAFKAFVRAVRKTSSPLTYATLNGRRYACHNGVPVLVSEYVPTAREGSSKRTDVWCMTLGLEDNGVFGVVPQDVGDNGLIVESTQSDAGISASAHRVRWYCAVILGHYRGLAGLTGVEVGTEG